MSEKNGGEALEKITERILRGEATNFKAFDADSSERESKDLMKFIAQFKGSAYSRTEVHPTKAGGTLFVSVNQIPWIHREAFVKRLKACPLTFEFVDSIKRA